MEKSVAIIIPSYNDSENIPLVVSGIQGILPKATIIIIDDSPDKTGIRAYGKANKDVIIIERSKKSGRGSAVLEGFAYALKNKNIEYVFEMDADTSHDPKDIKKFLEKQHTDVVIGSRYIQGSKIINWPKKRLFLSTLINSILLNGLFHLGIHDYTNGFRMYSRKAAEYLLCTKFHETGFLLLSETAYALKKAGFTITEVPITFTDRKYGQSSVKFTDLLNNFVGAFKIRFLY